MRKILSTLMLLLTVAFLSFGQDIKPIDPINFKPLPSPSFSYMTLDSAVWIYKGSTYGWTRIPTKQDVRRISTGCLTSPVLTDNGNGTVTINQVRVNIYPTPNFMGNMITASVATATFTITNGAEEYISVRYNNGAPAFFKETVGTAMNHSDNLPIFVVWRLGLVCHSLNFDSLGSGLANKAQSAMYHTDEYKLSSDGGLAISESITPNPRTVIMSGGLVYTGAVPQDVGSFNSSVDQMTLAYHVGGVWNYTDNLVYNNTQYDNGTNLVAGNNNKFMVRWFYRSIGDVKQVFYVLGTTYYNNIADASLEQPRSDLPLIIRHHCLLVGRSIIEYNITSGVTQDLIKKTYAFSTVINHDDTGNKSLAGTGVTWGHINDQAQTIYGVKDFNSTPTSTATPTTGSQLTNKNYVDTKDPSITNEGQLSTIGTTNNATIQSNTSGSNILNLRGSGINVVSASGNTITITGTEIDGSVTNEIQAPTRTGDLIGLTQTSTTISIADKVPFTVLDDMKDPTGFLDGSNINVSYDWTSRTVTLTGDLTYYWKGVKKTLTSPWTSTPHAATQAKWFLYSTDGTNFAWSQSVWTFDFIQVAAVTYKATAAASIAIRETHGLMPWQSHQELHDQVGTYLQSGGKATAGTFTLNTATDAATTPGFDAFILKDEDLLSSEAAWLEGAYTTMYIGASNTSVFNITSSFPFISTGSYMQWNNATTGTLTNGVTLKYYNVYEILIPVASSSNSQKYRVVLLQPQVEYSSQAAAESEVAAGLNLGELAAYSPEFKVYARITYTTLAADNNTGKCRIANITYLLGSNSSVVNAPLTSNSHSALSNLSWNASGHTGTNSTLAAFDASGVTENLAKGDLIENTTGLEFSSTRQVIGGTTTLSVSTGYVIPTTTNISHGESGYDNQIISMSVSGTSTKTITLTQQDAGTVGTTFSVDDHTNRTALNAVSGVNTGDQTIPIALPTPNVLTMNNSGSGDASGSTFNGSAAKTISYNTIGAAPASGSGNYIWNNNLVPQNGGYWINGNQAKSTFAGGHNTPSMEVSPTYTSNMGSSLNYLYGFRSIPTYNSIDDIYNLYGVFSAPRFISATSTNTIENIYGYVSEPTLNGTGTAKYITGVYSKPTNEGTGNIIGTYANKAGTMITGGGTISAATNIYTEGDINGSIGNYFDIKTTPPIKRSGGLITNYTALYIEDARGVGTNNNAIYSQGGDVKFMNSNVSTDNGSRILNMTQDAIEFRHGQGILSFNRNTLTGDIYDVASPAWQINKSGTNLFFQSYGTATGFRFYGNVLIDYLISPKTKLAVTYNTGEIGNLNDGTINQILKTGGNGDYSWTRDVDMTSYKLNGNNLFSAITTNNNPKWDGTKFVDSNVRTSGVNTIITSNNIYSLQLWKDATPTYAAGIGVDDGNFNVSVFNGSSWLNRAFTISHTTGSVTIPNLASTNARLPLASSTGQLTAITNNVGYLFNDGGGNFSNSYPEITSLRSTGAGANQVATANGSNAMTFQTLKTINSTSLLGIGDITTGNVSHVNTTVNTHLGVWSGNGMIEGSDKLSFTNASGYDYLKIRSAEPNLYLEASGFNNNPSGGRRGTLQYDGTNLNLGQQVGGGTYPSLSLGTNAIKAFGISNVTASNILYYNTATGDITYGANSGGTGMTNPMTTTGDMIYSNPGATPVRLGIGSSGQFLSVVGGVPSWVNSPSGTTQWITSGNNIYYNSGNIAVGNTPLNNIGILSNINLASGYAGWFQNNNASGSGVIISTAEANGTNMLLDLWGNSSTSRFSVSTSGAIRMANIASDATPTDVLYWNPSTQMVTHGAKPSGGGGGVSSVSASTILTGTGGNFATVSVSNPTTTPNIAYTLSSQTANLGFRSPNGSSGTPSYRRDVYADISDIYAVQALSGTAPTWSAISGMNATLTLSGNTTITMSNLSVGMTGNIRITNNSTAFTLSWSGYTFEISPSVWSIGDTVVTSGGSKTDCYSWYYDGTKVLINGTLGYK